VHSRDVMKQAARDFIELARAQDRIAIYALAGDLFHVITPLTSERSKLAGHIDALPNVAGTTPLYDAIALSYLQENLHRSERRTALVVLTDALDTSLAPHVINGGSQLSFADLKRMLAELRVIVYFILVPSPPGPHARAGIAIRRIAELAAATGGKAFHARATADLTPVYRQVAEQLRGTYAIAYHPRNQNFDGSFRKVSVLVRKTGLTARTKPGYHAH
jgi:Ca-activated chloride channel homolog